MRAETASDGLSILIAPDSYKGCLPANAVARALAEGWLDVRPEDAVFQLPMADGGEGTLDLVQLAIRGVSRHVESGLEGPDRRTVDVPWLLLPDGTALVELASVSGLDMMSQPDPLGATTRGLGQVIGRALDAGSDRLLIALGGSATTDGGCGALRELGLELVGATNRTTPDGGGGLEDLVGIATSSLRRPPPRGVELLVDVDSPLLGPRGAAAAFGPQKGADPEQVQRLEAGLARFSALAGGRDDEPGSGAAGGTAYGFATFWAAQIRSGSQVVGDLVGIPGAVQQADLVVTGEGAFDRTSLAGKVVGYILNQAQQWEKPVGVVAGLVREELPRVWRTVGLTDLAPAGSACTLTEPVRWLKEAGRCLAQSVDELEDRTRRGR